MRILRPITFLLFALYCPVPSLAQGFGSSKDGTSALEPVRADARMRKYLDSRALNVSGRLKGTIVTTHEYPNPPSPDHKTLLVTHSNGVRPVPFHQVVTTEPIELYLSPTRSLWYYPAPSQDWKKKPTPAQFATFRYMDLERNFVENGMSPLRSTNASEADKASVAHARQPIDSYIGIDLAPHFVFLDRIAAVHDHVEIKNDGSGVEAVFSKPTTIGPYYSKVRWQANGQYAFPNRLVLYGALAIDDELVRWDLQFPPVDDTKWTAPFPKIWRAAMGQRVHEGAKYSPLVIEVTWDEWEEMPWDPVAFYHKNTFIRDSRFDEKVPTGMQYKWSPKQTEEDILQLVRRHITANAAGRKQADQMASSGLVYTIAGALFLVMASGYVLRARRHAKAARRQK